MDKLKIEQIAFGVKYPEEVIKQYRSIGLTDWIKDTVTAEGTVWGTKKCINVADLYFNYDLGYELELLHYRAGNNWHNRRNELNEHIFLSHKGIHVTGPEMSDWMRRMKNIGCGIAQEVDTLTHTNPNIAGKRKYHYVVFDSKNVFGFDLKLIRRIDLPYPVILSSEQDKD